MKRALLAWSLLSSGCALHYETQRNLPAKLTAPIDAPPAQLSGRGVSDHGDDEGMRGWLGHMAVYAGGVIDSKGSGGAAGLEIGATPFELDKWHTPDVPFEAQPRIWIRPSIGWMFVDESSLRSKGGRNGAGIGAVYGEVQLFPWQGKAGFGVLQIGVGGLVEVAYEDGGVQSTVCAGPHVLIMMICLRGAYLANRGPELGIFLGANGLGSVAWAK